MVLGWDSVGMCDYDILCYEDWVWPRMAAQPQCLACKLCIYYCKNASGVIFSAMHVESVTDPPSENTAFKTQMKQI